MKNYLRWIIVVALISSIVLLAKNKVVWAGDLSRVAIQSGTMQVTGYVWNDVDQDGVQDVGEHGIPNVTVNLFDSAKVNVNTALTDVDGRYLFENLALGEYYVEFVPPVGYVFSPKDKIPDDVLDSDADVLTGETNLGNLADGVSILNWDAGLYSSTTFLANRGSGTVKPPPADVTVCDQGDFSVGGVSILKVRELKPEYCLTAFLRNHAFALGRIPDGAGKVLANITFVRVFYHGDFVYEVPVDDGNIEICYAVPPGMQAQLYFFDFYGPRFGKGNGQPIWKPLQTTVTDGVACAAAQTSGAYALIGK